MSTRAALQDVFAELGMPMPSRRSLLPSRMSMVPLLPSEVNRRGSLVRAEQRAARPAAPARSHAQRLPDRSAEDIRAGDGGLAARLRLHSSAQLKVKMSPRAADADEAPRHEQEQARLAHADALHPGQHALGG